MHVNLRIHHRNDIDLALSQLLLKYWPLLKADTNLHGISERVRLLILKPLLLLLNHSLKVHINLNAL